MKKFWVGDPCYHDGISKPHKKWHRLLDEAGYFNGGEVLVFEGRLVGGCGTMWGDGVYFDAEGNSYPVDAGLIGFVEHRDDDEIPFGMTLHEFSSAPTIQSYNGTIVIAGGNKNVVIETGDDLELEED